MGKIIAVANQNQAIFHPTYSSIDDLCATVLVVQGGCKKLTSGINNAEQHRIPFASLHTVDGQTDFLRITAFLSCVC